MSVHAKLTVVIILYDVSVAALVGPCQKLIAAVHRHRDSCREMVCRADMCYLRVCFLYKLHADSLLIHLHRQTFCIVALVYLADFLIARILHTVYLVRTQKLHKQSVQILCSRSDYYLVRVHIHTAKR